LTILLGFPIKIMQIAELLVIQNEQRYGVEGGFNPLAPHIYPIISAIPNESTR
jgi:hypothetical protein